MGIGFNIGGFDPVGFVKYDLLGKETPEEKAQKRAEEANIRMWNLQNEYNTPANQVARLRAAGLNPNLFYDKGTTGNSSGVPTFDPVLRQSSSQNILNLLSGVVGLKKELGDMKRADRALDLQERSQDLDALKFQSAIAHQKDAMELERKKMAVELAFRNSDLARRDRDYDLRKAQFEWQKSKPQGGAVGFADKLISATLGRSTTDVASDTNNFLNYAVEYFFNHNIVPASFGIGGNPLVELGKYFYRR